MKFLNNKYRRWYKTIVGRASGRETEPNTYEKHHIRPRVLGGSNKRSNIVLLTYREHFLVHWLLVKFTTGLAKRKMSFALHRLTFSKRGPVRTSWQYDVVRRSNSSAVSKSWKDSSFRNRQEVSRKKTWARPEVRKRLSDAMSLSWSPERRSRQSKVQKALWNDDEKRKALSKKSREVWSDPILKKRHSDTLKAVCRTPEGRLRMSINGSAPKKKRKVESS